MMGLMSHRRRRVFVDTPKGRRNAGFTVPETADAADVSMRLRERGWAPYRLRLILSSTSGSPSSSIGSTLPDFLAVEEPTTTPTSVAISRRLAETNFLLSTGQECR